MRLRFICNPRAGISRDRSALAAALQRFIAQHRLDATVVETSHAGHATTLAAAAVADRCDVVVAVGGDGTLNEVARSLVGTSTALGLVPRGSGNGLARHLRVPLATEAALATLLTGQVRPIDAGEADGRVFFCAMGAGFDAAVLARFNTLGRRGFSAYLTAAALTFARHRPEKIALHTDGASRLNLTCLLVAVANAAQFGNGAIIAPAAVLDDGLLDLAIVSPVNLLTGLPLLVRLFAGTLDRSRHVQHLRCRTALIERPAAGPMHVDGELVSAPARIEVRVRPACLRVLAP